MSDTDDESMFRRVPPPAFNDYEALAVYNAERSRGIVHRAEWIERMALIQEVFNGEQMDLFEKRRAVEHARNRRRRGWFV